MTPQPRPPAPPAEHRSRRWLVAAAAGVLVLAGIAISLLLRPGAEQTPDSAAHTPSPTPTPRPTAAGDPGWVAPARTVTLPEGADQLDELPIGFPRTPEGAAGAEVAKNRYGGLDYEFAAQVMQTYVAPDLAATYEQVTADAVRELRARVGAPATGDVPLALGMTVRPFGVQWRELSDTDVEVSVLVYTDYRSIDREWTEINGSSTTWRWMTDQTGREDWRIVSGRPTDAPLADLGTEAFNDGGWIALASTPSP